MDAAGNLVMIHDAESGQKLLAYLQGKMPDAAAAMLHKWIRTGQVRRNGRRCKPFERISAGDAIRLPPMAAHMLGRPREVPETACDALHVIGTIGDILAIDKPSGLPTHGGTGHADSVADRLDKYFGNAFFRPVPAHRLDRETSGVLLAATSFESLLYLQGCFREHTADKRYLAWVEGRWPHAEARTMRHMIRKEAAGHYEKMAIMACNEARAKSGLEWREAVCVARPLQWADDKTLLQIILRTGRKHQIRAQLAHMGHPVVGDAKYGSSPDGCGFYLHCASIALPNGLRFGISPMWRGEFEVKELNDRFAG